jgi:hypothetical protein
MIVLSACKKDAVNKSVTNGKTTPVTFSLGFAQSTGSFNGAANITNSKFSTHTLAVDTTLAKYASVIYAGVYASDGSEVFLTKQLSTDTTFGTVSFNLSPGNYTVVFIAGQSDILFGPDKLSNSDIEYATLVNGNPVYTWKDTFFQKVSLTVGNTGIDQSVTLNRIGSQIIVNIEDAIPANVKFIAFSVSDGSVGTPQQIFNINTGAPSASSSTGLLFANTSVSTPVTAGATNTQLCIPTMGNPNHPFNLQIFAYDQLPPVPFNGFNFNGELISYFTSATVTVQSGHQTVLSGKLFGGNGLTNTGGFQMTVDPQWSTTTTTIPFQ